MDILIFPLVKDCCFKGEYVSISDKDVMSYIKYKCFEEYFFSLSYREQHEEAKYILDCDCIVVTNNNKYITHAYIGYIGSGITIKEVRVNDTEDNNIINKVCY